MRGKNGRNSRGEFPPITGHCPEKSDGPSTGRRPQDGELSAKRKMYAAVKSAWGLKVKKKQNNNKNKKHIEIKK